MDSVLTAPPAQPPSTSPEAAAPQAVAPKVSTPAIIATMLQVSKQVSDLIFYPAGRRRLRSVAS